MINFTNIDNETLLEIKTISITSPTGTGSLIATKLDIDNIIILSCECNDYIATPCVINNKYYISISKYMNIGNDMYAFGGINQTVTVLIKYMVVK